MKRLVVLAAAFAVVATACAERGAHVVGPAGTGPTASVPPSEIPVTATASASGPVEVPSTSFQVWFTRNDHLFEVPWVVPRTLAVGRASLEALLGGPPQARVAQGVGTQVPPGTTLLDLSIADGLATVNLSNEFLSGGSAVSAWTRLGQVVWTIAQFPSVTSVVIQLDGQPIKPFDVQGGALGRPWQRSDFEQLLPAIVVEQPTIGDSVGSPVTVSGTADVFEATVSLRILHADGTEIAR